MTPIHLETHIHDAAGARAIQEQLFALYARIYADQLSDPFYSIERFAERFTGHSSRPGYRLITGQCGGNLLGYAYGVPLGPNTLWWEGLRTEVPPAALVEDGTRTFAVNEIMVDERWRRRGIARVLHDALLNALSQRRATLLVDSGNAPAKTAYLSWGWQEFGQLQPYPDAPLYDALILDLTSR
jgi:GNAT superfamily N-acetyltransferase